MRGYLHFGVIGASFLSLMGLGACVTHDDGADPVCDCDAADTGGDTADTGGDTADTGGDSADTGGDTGAETGADTSDTATP